MTTSAPLARHDGGRSTTYSATYCVMACGNLSTPHRPAIEGLDDFEGDWHHTRALAARRRRPRRQARRRDRHRLDRHPADPAGSPSRRSTCTCSSGRRTSACRRTTGRSIPTPVRAIKAGYRERRRLARESLSGVPGSHPDALPQRSALEVAPEERARAYERGWATGGIGGITLAFNDIITERRGERARPPTSCATRSARSSATRRPPRRSVRRRTRSAPSASASTRTTSRPTTAPTSRSSTSAAPRSCGSPRAGSRPRAATYELDVIVFATGFDAMTGALLDIDVRGREGRPLKDKWSGGPRTYLGLATAGFPNLFIVTGPGSPSVLSNMVLSIEQHVDWIADCIGHLRERGLDHDRGDARRRGRVGRARQRGRRGHAVPARELLVHGGEHPRQAARVHAVSRRRRQLPGALRRRRRRTATRGSVRSDDCDRGADPPLHRWRVGRADRRTLVEVVNPTTEEPIGRVDLAGPSDMDRAVRPRMRRSTSGPWAASTPAERAATMIRAGELIAERAEAFARTITLEVGSPQAIAAWQPVAARLYLDWHAAQAETFPWEEEREGIRGPMLVRRGPVGVVGAIVPWNFPLALSFPKLAPALLTGCSVDPQAADADAPVRLPAGGGVSRRPACRRACSTSCPPIARSASSSSATRWSTRSASPAARAPGAGSRRCAASRSSAAASSSAASPPRSCCPTRTSTPSIPALAPNTMRNNGQTCTNATRVLAPRERYAEVVEALREQIGAYPVGDPADPDVAVGPLVSAAQRERVEDYIATGRDEGARLVLGGGRARPRARLLRRADDLRRRRQPMTIAQEEIFGPVVCVIPYDDEDDAVAIANDSATGSRAASGARTPSTPRTSRGGSAAATSRSTSTRSTRSARSAASSSRDSGARTASRGSRRTPSSRRSPTCDEDPGRHLGERRGAVRDRRGRARRPAPRRGAGGAARGRRLPQRPDDEGGLAGGDLADRARARGRGRRRAPWART